MLLFACYHFGCRIAWTAASCLEHLAVLVGVRQTKIHNLNLVACVQQQIFWLQVAVYDVEFVDVFDSSYNLLKKSTGFFFLNTLVSDNVVEELAPTCLLHD
jgi:hypothetical protein